MTTPSSIAPESLPFTPAKDAGHRDEILRLPEVRVAMGAQAGYATQDEGRLAAGAR